MPSLRLQIRHPGEDPCGDTIFPHAKFALESGGKDALQTAADCLVSLLRAFQQIFDHWQLFEQCSKLRRQSLRIVDSPSDVDDGLGNADTGVDQPDCGKGFSSGHCGLVASGCFVLRFEMGSVSELYER
nr:hypothetical protein CFP56_02827 [Quercus suber]